MKFTVPAQLKRIRERSGLSVREMASRVDLSPSGYTHYENEKRFKGDYLPLPEARRFARAMRGTGVAEAEILALAGSIASNPTPSAAPTGFCESDAAPFIHVQDSPADAAAKALSPAREKALIYRTNRTIPSLCLLAGDALVIQTTGAQKEGATLLVSYWLEDGTGINLLRRRHHNLLVSAEPGDAMPIIDIDDSQRVAIIGEVIASFRGA